MALKRYTDEDILQLLREIELNVASGSNVPTACCAVGIIDAGLPCKPAGTKPANMRQPLAQKLDRSD